MSCGTKLLTPLELILLQMLMTDEDELNDLETDMDFFGEFMNMPEEHEKLARIDFLKECNERVNKRKCICQIVTLECIVQDSQSFPIMDRKVYEKIKFEFMAIPLIHELKNPHKLDFSRELFTQNLTKPFRIINSEVLSTMKIK